MRKFSAVFVVVAAASLGRGMRLQSRAAQTSAICLSQFSWMQNSKGASPCQVASSVDAICNNGNWLVPMLPPNTSYANPTPVNGTVSFCTCSWASYNLLSACTTCQGIGQETPTWTDYSVECAGFLTNTFFPTNITIPDGVAIPAWAQANPTTAWDGQTFNAFQAQQIANEGKPDFVGGSNGSTAPGHKSTNVGAIVGGVIGGLVVLASAILAAFWIIRRKQAGASAPSNSFRHRPTFSDAGSVVKMPNGSYAPMMSQPTSAPTINSSMRSFPVFGSMMEARPQNIIPSHTPVPNHIPPSTLNGSSPENIIEPFTLLPAVNNPDSKQSLGSQPIYDHPSAPPPMRIDSTRSATPRARINPPEYTPSSPGSVTSSLPRHANKASVDTQHSRSASTDTYGHNPIPSGSGMSTMLGLAPVPESSHGRNLSGESHDVKRADGGVMEYSASDIA